MVHRGLGTGQSPDTARAVAHSRSIAIKGSSALQGLVVRQRRSGLMTVRYRHLHGRAFLDYAVQSNSIQCALRRAYLIVRGEGNAGGARRSPTLS